MIDQKKEHSIETIRGLAILMMVAGHVIGNKSTSGLTVEDDSMWRFLYFLVGNPMPLFTALSGYVYALKPLSRDHIAKFFIQKSQRILLPMVSVATLQYLFNVFTPNVNNTVYLNDLWRIYIFPYAQFWFLQALFLVFVFVAVLEYYQLMSSFRGWLISSAIVSVIYIAANSFLQLNFFSFSGFLYLFPFFIFGLGIKRFYRLIFKKQVLLIFLFIMLFAFLLQQYNWFKPVIKLLILNRLLNYVVSITGICLLFYIRKPIGFLTILGYSSYCIYLFHVFGTAGSRVFLQIFGVENRLIIFIIALALGMAMPMIVEKFIVRSKVLRKFFLGLN
jgi:glucans biosynthesis protein C